MEDIEFDGVFAETEFTTSTNVDKIPSKNNDKKSGSGSMGSASKGVGKSHYGGKPSDEKQQQKQPAIKIPGAEPSSSKSGLELVHKDRRKRGNVEPVSKETSLKRLKQTKEKRKGKATLGDLDACINVGQSGAELFKEMQDTITGKMTEQIQVKITSLDVESRYVDGELIQTTRDLRTVRDQNLLVIPRTTEA